MSSAYKCDELCSAHKYVEESVKALEGIARQLSEGQTEIRINLARLTENMESVSRLHDRIDVFEAKMEDQQRFIYKLIGGLIVISIGLPLVLRYLL